MAYTMSGLATSNSVNYWNGYVNTNWGQDFRTNYRNQDS